MTSTRSTEPAETSLTQDLLYAARYYLGGRRGLLILAGLAVAAGLALNWSWLVAAGIAPILIGAVPCVAMCALGLCMNRAGGRSCASGPSTPEAATPDDETASASRAAAPDVPSVSSVEQSSNGTVAVPLADPAPQPLKQRSTTDA